jgi:hypothetical protein
MLSVIVLSVIMQSVIMLSVIMLSVILLSVITLSVIMLSVIMLNVIMLSVIMLNVVMQCRGASLYAYNTTSINKPFSLFVLFISAKEKSTKHCHQLIVAVILLTIYCITARFALGCVLLQNTSYIMRKTV